ncbi:MAG: hypothetical protein F4235_03135 [Candidatus Dadabacteria bacterium]|nr:hypothetical protein [Candidatus Dadabacteria bacterium]MYE61048.1 hypothetical protein [Candidatus Dadabacteria bacterium]
MKNEKYQRSVKMLCPTCGGSSYQYEQAVDEAIEIVKCASCGRELTKNELIRENGENINKHLSEMTEEVKADIKKEFRASLKKAFRGSKNIRIK